MWPFGVRIKDGVAGTAYVSSCGGVPPSMQASINIGSTYGTTLRLVVTLPGHEPYAATVDVNADPNRPVEAGMTLPVLVERSDPQKIKVDVKSIPRLGDRADQAQAEDLAAIRAGRAPRP